MSASENSRMFRAMVVQLFTKRFVPKTDTIVVRAPRGNLGGDITFGQRPFGMTGE